MRGFATAAAAVALLVGVALLDRDRETAPTRAGLAAVPDPPGPGGLTASASAQASFASAGGCIGAGDLAEDVPSAPALTPRGVEEIAARVERIRELRFDGPVEADFLVPDVLERRLARLVDTEYPQALADRQAATLELLGAIPPDTDLLELTRTTLASQVIGLYVPETGELLVSRSGEPGALEAITLAHELQHALADDALGLPIPTRANPLRADRDLAARALVEGDATLTMELYALRYVELSEQLSLSGVAGGEDDLEGLPDFIQRQILFPYSAGFEFVCERYAEGGWEAVDYAYEEDPPKSTAELMANSLTNDDPGRPLPSGTLPPPWDATLRSQVGAAELSWLFAAPGGDPSRALPDPEGAAVQWGGGETQLWEDGERSALSMSISDAGLGELCGAVKAWYVAAFGDETLIAEEELTILRGPERSGAIVCEPGSVRVGIGTDPETAVALAAPSGA